MGAPRYGNGGRELAVRVFFIDELEYFTPDELNVACGYLVLGDQPREGYEKVVCLEEVEVEEEDGELHDEREWVAREIRAINVFDVESVFHLIAANTDLFADKDLSPAGLESDSDTNADLALVLAGEAIARYFHEEVLAGC